MLDRLPRWLRIAGLLLLAFLLGGGSAEVAVRTHRAVEVARLQRELGSAGQLVALQLTGPSGEILARPRVVAPDGKRVEVVLHDPMSPEDVRVAFRLEAAREPTGDIELRYRLWVPERAIATQGTISLVPGVEQAIVLEDGTLVATWLAVPVPSAMFDAFLEAERARGSGLEI